MTTEQKETIKNLRYQGVTMVKIAEQLGMSINTVKAYWRRAELKKGLCKYCHKPLVQVPGRKPKTYCDDTCRYNWWRLHREQANHHVVYHNTCAYCHKEFESFNKDRKYCCHPCYISARFGDA